MNSTELASVMRPVRRGVAIVVCSAGALVVAPAAWAQEKQKLSFSAAAGISKYVQQHTIAAGDVPGHEVRIFELVRTFPKDGPLIGGVRVKESRAVGCSDYTDLNGPATTYTTYVMDNGDKIFTRSNIVAHAVVGADGQKKGATNLVSGPITGGTGKFMSVRGTFRNQSSFDPKTGVNQSRFDVEYWMEK